MTQISVDSSLIREAIAVIQARGQDLAKLAEVRQELDILSGLVDLSLKGHIDPADIMEKSAEYSRNPEDFRVFKKAAELGHSAPKLGESVPRSDSLSKTAAFGVDPAAKLHSDISDLLRT